MSYAPLPRSLARQAHLHDEFPHGLHPGAAALRRGRGAPRRAAARGDGAAERVRRVLPDAGTGALDPVRDRRAALRGRPPQDAAPEIIRRPDRHPRERGHRRLDRVKGRHALRDARHERRGAPKPRAAERHAAAPWTDDDGRCAGGCAEPCALRPPRRRA